MRGDSSRVVENHKKVKINKKTVIKTKSLSETVIIREINF
ncbi:hypothetical protein AKA01nite_03740 [Alkalibacterium kapii]|uniref:Uncharacterized protein n=1 Tax=Alkalibacterium kapii TaxID=426704 RepID=A0A511ASN3_9LACT|nr:hypothetical protein AKA01nite_03740 [Alkalibacterium kapii]